jgi:hypothetical protein
MPDQETWRFINSFAPWFSATATTASAIVALYLAVRTSRVKLRVHTDIYKVVGAGQSVGAGKEYLQVRATNIGFREATIQGVMWRTGCFRRKKYVQIPSDDLLSARVPVKLSYSEEASFLFPLEQLRQQEDPVGDVVRGSPCPRLAARWVRAGVYSTTGGEHIAKVGKNVRQEILREKGKQSA